MEGSDCIFPFSYKGETYNSCTRVESSNGAAWCATEVDSSGEVVNDKWEDCDSLCPGSDFPCAEGFLNNDEGKCVDEFEASSFLDGPLPAILDDISEFSQEPAPLCNPWIFFLGGRGAPSDKICRCTKEPAVIGLDGTPQGGCTPPRVWVTILWRWHNIWLKILFLVRLMMRIKSMVGVTWRTSLILPTLVIAAMRMLSGQRLMGGSGPMLPVWKKRRSLRMNDRSERLKIKHSDQENCEICWLISLLNHQKYPHC